MKTCPGQLVVHGDGTVAYCTEETAGRRCRGEDHPHRGRLLRLSCRRRRQLLVLRRRCCGGPGHPHDRRHFGRPERPGTGHHRAPLSHCRPRLERRWVRSVI